MAELTIPTSMNNYLENIAAALGYGAKNSGGAFAIIIRHRYLCLNSPQSVDHVAYTDYEYTTMGM